MATNSRSQDELCVICLASRKCGHTRRHHCKGMPSQPCGPWAVCAECSELVCQQVTSGQFSCPVCKTELGPLRQDGSEMPGWEAVSETPVHLRQAPIESAAQRDMRERNLPELRRQLNIVPLSSDSRRAGSQRLGGEASRSAPTLAAAPPTPGTQRARWAAVLNRRGGGPEETLASKRDIAMGYSHVCSAASTPAPGSDDASVSRSDCLLQAFFNENMPSVEASSTLEKKASERVRDEVVIIRREEASRRQAMESKSARQAKDLEADRRLEAERQRQKEEQERLRLEAESQRQQEEAKRKEANHLEEKRLEAERRRIEEEKKRLKEEQAEQQRREEERDRERLEELKEKERVRLEVEAKHREAEIQRRVDEARLQCEVDRRRREEEQKRVEAERRRQREEQERIEADERRRKEEEEQVRLQKEEEDRRHKEEEDRLRKELEQRQEMEAKRLKAEEDARAQMEKARLRREEERRLQIAAAGVQKEVQHRRQQEEQERLLVEAERRRRKEEAVRQEIEAERRRREQEQEQRRQLEQKCLRLEEEKNQLLLDAERRRQEHDKNQRLVVEDPRQDHRRHQPQTFQEKRRHLEDEQLRVAEKRRQLDEENRRVVEKRRLLDAEEQAIAEKRRRLGKEESSKTSSLAHEAPSGGLTTGNGVRPVQTPARARRTLSSADDDSVPDDLVRAVLTTHMKEGAETEVVEISSEMSRHLNGTAKPTAAARMGLEAPSQSPKVTDGPLLARIQDRMRFAAKPTSGAPALSARSGCAASSSSHPLSHHGLAPSTSAASRSKSDMPQLSHLYDHAQRKGKEAGRGQKLAANAKVEEQKKNDDLVTRMRMLRQCYNLHSAAVP